MEKLSGTRWLNVYRDKRDGMIWQQHYNSRTEADRCAKFFDGDERLACIEVPWVQGQGLEAVR